MPDLISTPLPVAAPTNNQISRINSTTYVPLAYPERKNRGVTLRLLRIRILLLSDLIHLRYQFPKI